MKLLLSIVAIGVVPWITNAQEVDLSRWEVGIDMLTLIGRNQVSPSIFVKKLDLKQKRYGSGFVRRGPRLRAGALVNTTHFTNQPDYKYYDIIIRPGYEWDKKLKSVDVLLAIDAVAGLNRAYFPEYFMEPRYDVTSSEGRYGLSPVAGVSYGITKNIKISAESAADILFKTTKRKFHEDGSDVGTVTNHGILIHLYPLYVLNAVFVF